MFIEILIYSSLLLLALAVLVWKRSGVDGASLTAIAILGLAVCGALLWKPETDLQLELALPAGLEPEAGLATSDSCRACHPDQYRSWHRSYHRTMTQAATPEAVLAPFEGVRLVDGQGEPTLLTREGNGFWVEMKPFWQLEPGRGDVSSQMAGISRVRQRIVMTTGSHHLQAYWMQLEDYGGAYLQFPWIYQIGERRWIPAADSFLKPPLQGVPETPIWNQTCIDCHTVGGQPRLDLVRRTVLSRVGELGIACESCHGPAGEHIRANQAPQRRYYYHLTGRPDPTIVQPERLSPRRASEVCGQCHSVSGPLEPEKWQVEGRVFRAGDKLEETRRIVRFSQVPQDPVIHAWLRQNPEELRGRFWPDGTVRVAGREYNGLIESGCFQRGDLSCLSCHSMHSSHPDGQLAKEMESNEACFQCHSSYRDRLQQHTRHPPETAGSLCYNCHMPHTTYGLFEALRSHRIDSPSVEISLRSGRPNACNLCHLDQSLAWSQQHLSDWYGLPEVPMSPQEEEISAALLWLLRGDAAQRALSAWSMGWAAAHRASGRGWQAPFLAPLLEDPYAAVRYVAYRTLRKLPGYADFRYDFVGPPQQRKQAREQAFALWQTQGSESRDRRGTRILLDQSAELQREALAQLLAQRDDRPVRIIE